MPNKLKFCLLLTPLRALLVIWLKLTSFLISVMLSAQFTREIASLYVVTLDLLNLRLSRLLQATSVLSLIKPWFTPKESQSSVKMKKPPMVLVMMILVVAQDRWLASVRWSSSPSAIPSSSRYSVSSPLRVCSCTVPLDQERLLSQKLLLMKLVHFSTAWMVPKSCQSSKVKPRRIYVKPSRSAIKINLLFFSLMRLTPSHPTERNPRVRLKSV